MEHVVAWETLLDDEPALLFAEAFWRRMIGHEDTSVLHAAVRDAFNAGKRAVLSATRPGGTLAIGGGKTAAASVPKYALHDPEDGVMVYRGVMSAAAGPLAGRAAAGVPVLVQRPLVLYDIPPLHDVLESLSSGVTAGSM